VFSCFLTMNPGQFFENAVSPLVPALGMSVIAEEFTYAGDAAFRSMSVHWVRIQHFCKLLFGRMKSAIPLLPRRFATSRGN